ncbi:hypothetical protein BDV11DRAFT_126198 [Aspergillus similis]
MNGRRRQARRWSCRDEELPFTITANWRIAVAASGLRQQVARRRPRPPRRKPPTLAPILSSDKQARLLISIFKSTPTHHDSRPPNQINSGALRCESHFCPLPSSSLATATLGFAPISVSKTLSTRLMESIRLPQRLLYMPSRRHSSSHPTYAKKKSLASRQSNAVSTMQDWTMKHLDGITRFTCWNLGTLEQEAV